jgi:hypothetical protein
VKPLRRLALIKRAAIGQKADIAHLHAIMRSWFLAAASTQLLHQYAIVQHAYTGLGFLVGEKTLLGLLGFFKLLRHLGQVRVVLGQQLLNTFCLQR